MKGKRKKRQIEEGQLKTGHIRKELMRIHLWCPDDLPRLWDRIGIEKQRNSGNVLPLKPIKVGLIREH